MQSTADSILQCPVCSATMKKVNVEDVVIDRCEKCFGIWLDKGERLKIVSSKKTADVVDIGAAKQIADEDRPEVMHCPRDGSPLERRAHPDQKHVIFEFCPECNGSFFDAGELRDLSRLSISDVVKNLFGL